MTKRFYSLDRDLVVKFEIEIPCTFPEFEVRGGGGSRRGFGELYFCHSIDSTLPILSYCQSYFSLSTSHGGSMNCVAVSSRPPFLF